MLASSRLHSTSAPSRACRDRASTGASSRSQWRDGRVRRVAACVRKEPCRTESDAGLPLLLVAQSSTLLSRAVGRWAWNAAPWPTGSASECRADTDNTGLRCGRSAGSEGSCRWDHCAREHGVLTSTGGPAPGDGRVVGTYPGSACASSPDAADPDERDTLPASCANQKERSCAARRS